MHHNHNPKTMQLLLVGGTFNTEGGRSSGYFGKLAAALSAQLPHAKLELVNGGTYDALAAKVDAVEGVTHLFWFADVPNEFPKLIPQIKQKYPGLVLITSKNNRKGLYDRAALYRRMQDARSELLVEFADGPSGQLVASVLTAQATVLVAASPDINEVALSVSQELIRLDALVFPLAKEPRPTADSESFVQRDFTQETEIPLSSHPGAFGVTRKNHVHEGVDMYGQPGDPVYAMEAGVVVKRQPFTGVAAGSPWWGDTESLMIAGASGALNYGEIAALDNMLPGTSVAAGELIGHLVTVLLKDKGRPRTMLHLERYVSGTSEPLREWTLGQEQPECLRDPTALLMQAKGKAGAQ